MKKSQHDIAYFLSNPYFVDWCKKPTEESEYFWKRWLKNHPFDKEAFYDAKTVLERTNFQELVVSAQRKEEILDNILKDRTSPVYEEDFFPIRRKMKLYPWLAAAAAILILLMASEFLSSSPQNINKNSSPSSAVMVTKYSKKAERTTFFLPDSTLVVLNAESTLSYSRNFESEIRQVTLTGEAYFDVRHDSEKKFLVNSGNIITMVHGTSFNVASYNDHPAQVSLERGSVSVCLKSVSAKNKTFKLIPGEKLIVDKDFEASKKSNFDFEEEFGWTKGILVFKDADLEYFVSELERWYGINIDIKGKTAKNWAINGRFKNQSLDNVLKSLEFSKGISYEIKDNQVTLNLNQ